MFSCSLLRVAFAAHIKASPRPAPPLLFPAMLHITMPLRVHSLPLPRTAPHCFSIASLCHSAHRRAFASPNDTMPGYSLTTPSVAGSGLCFTPLRFALPLLCFETPRLALQLNSQQVNSLPSLCHALPSDSMPLLRIALLCLCMASQDSAIRRNSIAYSSTNSYSNRPFPLLRH